MNREPDNGRSDSRPPDRRMGRAYQASFESVVAVAVGGVAGGYADQRFGTAPYLLMLGVLLGFGAFVTRLVRLMKELAPPPDPSEESDEGEISDRGSDQG